MNTLAQVAGRICPRSLAEMERAALALIADVQEDPLKKDQALVGFLADTVRLIREVGDRNTEQMMARPGGERLL